MTPSITIVVGNPKALSKTRHVAETVADLILAGLDDAALRSAEASVIELSALTGGLFDWGSPEVKEAVASVLASDIVIVATPTYKATYTGLLKVFLDRFGAGQLSRSVVIPVMLAAAPQHAMAVEVHLKPLLAELGAVMPTPAVFLLDSETGDAAAALGDWAAVSVPLIRSTAADLRARVSP